MNRREWLALSGALPIANGAAGHGATAEPADVGNLFDTLNWVSLQNRRRLSFLSPNWRSLDDWKAVARPAFHAHLGYNPSVAPAKAELVAEERRDGFSMETIRLKVTPAYSIPLRVLIPERRSGRTPAVLAMHCHGGRYVWAHEKVLSAPGDSADLVEYRNNAYGRPYAEVLARRGYIVAVSDAFYFGARRLLAEDLQSSPVGEPVYSRVRQIGKHTPGTPAWRTAVDAACSAYEHLTAKTILSAGATWPGMMVWDDMRCVDYLARRPEVDPKRLGCVGLSIGGLRTAHLAAADPRLKVACVAGWMTQFRTQLHHHLRHHTWMAYVPGLYESMDLPDAAALIAPGALLVQQCARDILFPTEGMRGAVEQLTSIFRKAGVPERFRGAFYDVLHSFGPNMQEEAFAWIDKWI
ncbi:MAG: hypothetical protein IT161_05335 [Bryobacterales bacterium]|nr:hypothetical protein [Bryobacterales bacterium]